MSLFTRWMESLAETIEINETCLRKISPFSKCEKCLDICEDDAITFDNGKPVIDEDKCTLCTKCITECVVHAIEGNVPKREVIHDTLIYNDEIAPSRTELLYYYKQGVIKLAVDGELNGAWTQQLESANLYLQVMDLEPFKIVKEKPEKSPAEYTRRDLFRHLAKESKDLAMSSFTPAKWRFNHKVFSLNKAYPDWDFYEIEMDKEKCNLCEICFKLCPEDVFKIQEDTTIMDLSKCNGCMLCQDVCPEQAINVREYVHPKKVIEQKFYSFVCRACARKALSWKETDNLCFVCERKKNLGYY